MSVKKWVMSDEWRKLSDHFLLAKQALIFATMGLIIFVLIEFHGDRIVYASFNSHLGCVWFV